MGSGWDGDGVGITFHVPAAGASPGQESIPTCIPEPVPKVSIGMEEGSVAEARMGKDVGIKPRNPKEKQ